MRLYLKLAVIVLSAVAAQWALKHGRVIGSDWWFAARCQFANVTNDEAMRERLVEEAQDYPYFVPPLVANAAGSSD